MIIFEIMFQIVRIYIREARDNGGKMTDQIALVL